VSSGAGRPPLTRAVIIGVTGRMGQALMHSAASFPQLLITGAIASCESLALGRDAGDVAGIRHANLTISSDLQAALTQADVALDFSDAAAIRNTLAACRAARKPLLLGTTGYGAELDPELGETSREVALLVAPNTSLGVTLLTEITRQASQVLPASFDIDVLELHHRLKHDAPSGTALALARAAAEARGISAPTGEGSGVPPGPRPEGAIGLASLRAGDIVGEHTVLFCGMGEELTLTHRARDRSVFARGALAAALWLSSQSPGRYGMRDFIFAKTEA
jgi:4-hydroxy-tetrahydrodipicolinate reductase